MDREPKWSPDGKTIAFYSNRSGTIQIWTINVDGSGLRQLFDPDIALLYPVWSPAGTRMAVRTPNRMFVLDARESWRDQTPEAITLSLPDSVAVAPYSWSANGRQLTLTAFGPDPSAGTYIYDFETRQVQKVFELSQQFLGARWLSDNRRLLLANQGRLHLIDSVAVKNHEILSVWPDTILGHSLSRDDRLIVYGLRSRRADIWLANLENGAPERQQ